MEQHTLESLKKTHGITIHREEMPSESRFGKILKPLCRACANFLKRQRYVAEYQRLLSVDDRILQDIGLERFEIIAALDRTASEWFTDPDAK